LELPVTALDKVSAECQHQGAAAKTNNLANNKVVGFYKIHRFLAFIA
jgi:hypothetical protein